MTVGIDWNLAFTSEMCSKIENSLQVGSEIKAGANGFYKRFVVVELKDCEGWQSNGYNYYRFTKKIICRLKRGKKLIKIPAYSIKLD